MHEVISIQCSHEAGHTLASLYNVQESHIPYSRNALLTHSNDVFLWPIKVRDRNNYFPRTIHFELSGGYGALGKHQFHEPKVDIQLFDQVEVIKKTQTLKSEYQKRLDEGLKTDSSMLNKENTGHWTDYSRLIYKPQALMEVGDFLHPTGEHRHFSRLKFDSFSSGVQAYKDKRDEIDDVFRLYLEGLDLLQGVNFFTGLDNAWAGYTFEMITDITDEYFNNGVANKHCIWVYGLLSSKESILNRIKGIVELSKSLTMLIPLATPRSGTVFTGEYDPSNSWHVGAVRSGVVNSLWGLNSQIENPVRMAEMEANMLRGVDRRNIVNDVSFTTSTGDQSGHGVFADVDILQMYLSGGPETAATQSASLALGETHGSVLGSCGATKEASESDAYVNKYLLEFSSIDTFPEILKNEFAQVTFRQTSGLKDLLKRYRATVQRARGLHFDTILGDRSELVEDISALVDEYTVGYEDESDWDD